MKVREPELDIGLVKDTQAFIERYVALTEDEALIESYYVAHTWAFHVANATPYLYINGEPQSGKTRNMEILELLTRTARRTTSISAPAMYTLLRKLHAPTLLYDEIDTVWARSGSSNQLTRMILNAGYRPGGLIYRQRGDEVEEYETFSPKVLAGVHNGHLPATVLTRTIPINMKAKRADQHVERFVYHVAANSPEREELLARIEKFVEDFDIDIAIQAPDLLPALTDRQNEMVEPLRQIAAVFGEEAEHELAEALQRIFSDQGTIKSSEAEIFGRIRRALDVMGKKVGDERRIFSEDLALAVGRAFFGKPKQLSLWLAPFDIQPELVRIGSDVRRGYTDAQFADAFARYLGPAQPGQA